MACDINIKNRAEMIRDQDHVSTNSKMVIQKCNAHDSEALNIYQFIPKVKNSYMAISFSIHTI